MSLSLVVLLVYTVGVKCRGINKKEPYAPEHIFSLSENTANKYLRQQNAMLDLIKHSRTHLVRIYPKGMRLSSSNYEPHRFWAAGAQLVAINWQTCDQGSMINHAMFQRNGRAGYVLKPLALREIGKELLTKHTKHVLDVTVISAQQVPRAREVAESKSSVDPYVEVSLHVPDWPTTTMGKASTPPPTAGTARTSYIGGGNGGSGAGGSGGVVGAGRATCRTCVIKDNGFNPVWQERLCLPFECVGDMMDLVFVRFAVKQEGLDEPLGVYCASLGSLQRGYRHLPLHDLRMSQFLFSTLFVKIDVVDA
jgi:phosphatidylinositol phospholipase C delta